jgi:Ca2+-binding EF-hand superfamily protein
MILRSVSLSCAIALVACAIASADDPPGETRDVFLMLDGAPKHIRLRLELGGRSLVDVQNDYIDRLMASLDTNGDGKLTREEAARSPLRPPSRKRGNNQFVTTLGPQTLVTREDIQRDIARIISDTVIYREDESAARNDDEIFKLLDADGSGEIDAEEMRTAFLRVLERDLDGDKCVTFDEFLPAQPEASELLVSQPGAEDRNAPRPTLSDIMRDVRQPALGRRLLKQYDQNKRRYLTAAELGWADSTMRLFDRNGDGRLDESELTDLARAPVDLELAVELSGSDDVPAIRLLGSAGADPETTPRPDLIRFRLGDVTLSFSFRKTDPVAQAVATAMQQFNRLDADGNGYLDRAEVSGRFRFERGLFAEMDRDGDDKVFGEEMKEYVAARATPAASSCQINIYNTGNGYFQLMDTNGDGRISMRELKRLEQTLLTAASRNSGKLTKSQTGRHYHIEFVRASYQLFGPADGMIARRPEFIQLPPVGPEWFKAWDRNGDGDLTWSEFLGPRRVFEELDLDHDGLIDHVEAERAMPVYGRALETLKVEGPTKTNDESDH